MNPFFRFAAAFAILFVGLFLSAIFFWPVERPPGWFFALEGILTLGATIFATLGILADGADNKR
ncbi:hypothetical protein CL65_gp083 [Mycobacterium phage Patience]|uniref:Uncharacterized protein n=1 Tax=Mycobacterium phage Patience TaxID=1074308 RepID=G1JWJ3_9CAUD|nr:hypothetical protein CL65_gp083 [Mycobacterium phage Patience]AEL97991.1 hypothetical protein PATIENCE_82 [Mycobacterium phage Patience]UOW93406.1 hypothetical protein SEA_LABELLE_81 [Mycobacterium phage Labelle]